MRMNSILFSPFKEPEIFYSADLVYTNLVMNKYSVGKAGEFIYDGDLNEWYEAYEGAFFRWVLVSDDMVPNKYKAYVTLIKD